MFVWEFVTESVLNEIIEWGYRSLLEFLNDFFYMMGNMGAELFEISYIKYIVTLFSSLGITLYVVGVFVSFFEFGIEYQSGRGSIKDVFLNNLKGFMSASLFYVLPVELYKLSISLQATFSNTLIGNDKSIGEVAMKIIGEAKDFEVGTSSLGSMLIDNAIFGLFVMILLGYAVIKIFFENLKRGGILLIQIAVGSLYMFSVPRGYQDGFLMWVKQIIALCFTAFLQATMLMCGLLILTENTLLGLGVCLAAGEIPKIAGNFGLDTSTKANLMGVANTANTAINMTRNVINAVK